MSRPRRRARDRSDIAVLGQAGRQPVAFQLARHGPDAINRRPAILRGPCVWVTVVCMSATEGNEEAKAAPSSEADRTASRTRLIIARSLVVLGALAAAIAIVAGYLRYQALDEPTFRGTAEAMVADPVFRDQVAASLVDRLYDEAVVADALSSALPPRFKPLAGPIASGAQPFIDRQASRLLSRPAAQELFVSSVVRARTGVCGC